MNLLTKTTLYYITLSVFIFFIGAICFYKLFSTLIERNVNNELINQRESLITELKSLTITQPGKLNIISSEKISIIEIDKITKSDYTLNDTILYDDFKKIYLPYRKITFEMELNNINYEVCIYKSLIKTNYLIENIALASTIMVFVFLLCIYFLNRYFFNKIWKDFFDTLNKIQLINIDYISDFKFSKSEITEFNKLNEVLNRMLTRISTDYTSLKHFTENITHELQTPLAIIKSKAEMLLQNENQSAANLKLINDIYYSTNRLSKLNHTLILLNKIEHHQFNTTEKVDISANILYHIENFESLINSKNIKLTTNIDKNVVLTINTELADILFINLLKNSIAHNIENGYIHIILKNEMLICENSGYNTLPDVSKIFDRFIKNPNNKESSGLGLALVKKICDIYNFKINYETNDNTHKFILNFSNLKNRS